MGVVFFKGLIASEELISEFEARGEGIDLRFIDEPTLSDDFERDCFAEEVPFTLVYNMSFKSIGDCGNLEVFGVLLVVLECFDRLAGEISNLKSFNFRFRDRGGNCKA